MDLKQLHTDMNKTWKELREIMDKQNKEVKEFGEATGETKGIVTKLNERLDSLEVKLNRSPKFGSKDIIQRSEKMNAFADYLKSGNLDPAFKKELTLSDDTTGGYLAPTEMIMEIIKDIIEWSPMREVARIRQTSNKAIEIPKRTGIFSAQWVAEIGQRDETEGLAWGIEEIPAHELYALVDISQQNLEDSAFNLESELQEEFAEQFAVAEATGFIHGNGVGKPEGVLTHPDIEEIPSGVADSITADGMIDLFYAIKDGYARNGSWMLRRSTIGEVRKLQDQQGNYLWQPGLVADQPPTILGRPYFEAIDLPIVEAGSTPVLFGDFNRGYTIVDRIMLSVLRDPYTRANRGLIRFIARKRVGGQVVQSEALKKLIIAE